MDLKKLYLLIGLAVVIVVVIILLLPGEGKQEGAAMPDGHPDISGMSPSKDNVRQDIVQRIRDLRKKVEAQAADDTTDLREFAMLTSAHKPEEAVIYFERILRKDPKNVDILTELSVCQANMGNMTDALKTTEKVLGIDPNYTPAMFNFGMLHAMNGEKDKARQAWDNLIRKFPDSEDAKRAKDALGQL